MKPTKVNLSPTVDYKGARRSLILAGGGMRLAYQAGVLKALEEHDLCFHHADGTSGGTINLAMLFSGNSPKEMCDNWRKLKIKEFVSYMKMEKYLFPGHMLAFGDADGIMSKVFPHLGVDIERINRAEGMIGTFNVCNYTNKTNVVNTHDRLTMDYLIAGMSLPIFMPPVPIGKEIFTDSVWIKDANLMEAVKRGAEEIWLVWAIGNISEYKGGAFNQYVHMIEISANGGLSLEFEYINELNKRIANGDSPYGQKQPIKLYVIKPEYPLPLDPDLYFDKINTGTLIDHGYEDAKKYLQNLLPIDFTPEATKMKNQGKVICYRGKLKGTFNSKELNGFISIDLSLVVQNLYSFLSANGECLQMVAHIQLADSGSISSVYNSKIDLVNESGKKVFQFNCQFENENEIFYLESKVTVNSIWTSIYKGVFKLMNANIYKGKDASGDLLGNVNLIPEQKLKFGSGVHVLNENLLWKKIKARRDFLAFISK